MCPLDTRFVYSCILKMFFTLAHCLQMLMFTNQSRIENGQHRKKNRPTILIPYQWINWFNVWPLFMVSGRRYTLGQSSFDHSKNGTYVISDFRRIGLSGWWPLASCFSRKKIHPFKALPHHECNELAISVLFLFDCFLLFCEESRECHIICLNDMCNDKST